MGVSKSARFDEISDDDFEGEDFEFMDDASSRRKSPRFSKASWRSVDDYLENRRLKNELFDVFDDE